MKNPMRGRPTDNPKTCQFSVRLDSECMDILNAYMKQENVQRVEAIRRGIKRLKDELK